MFLKPAFSHRKAVLDASNPVPPEALPTPFYAEPVMTASGDIMTADDGDILMVIIEI